MSTITFDRSDVQITALKFSKNSPQIRFESYPRRIVYGGREYILSEA
jgi:hypothetical protein